MSEPPFVDSNATAMRFRRRLLEASPRNRQMMARYLAGERTCDLAREYGVTPTRIAQIVAPMRLRNLRFRRVA